MLPEKIIYLAVFINLVGIAFYIRNILRGGTKPNLVSFFIWTLAPFVGIFLQIKAGAGFSFISTFMAGLGPLLVIIFSLIKKNAFWKIKTFDIICGLFSIFALFFYILTNKLGISILFAIISDALAAIPTIKKSWSFPKTETSVLYLTGIISNIFALLIIKNWTFSIYAFSIYLIIINIIIVFTVHRKKLINLIY